MAAVGKHSVGKDSSILPRIVRDDDDWYTEVLNTVFDSSTGQVHLLEQRLVVRRHPVGSDEPGQGETFPAFDQRSGDTER